MSLIQAVAERNHLSEECNLLTELLMLKHYKNLTDNRLNMSSARRKSIPQKKTPGVGAVKATSETNEEADALMDLGDDGQH